MSDAAIHRFFVTAPRGLVSLVAEELRRLGAKAVREEAAGCGVRGPLEFGYRICLWSRCASRVLLPLCEQAIDDPDQLYEAVRALPWEEHLRPEGTLLVNFTGRGAGVRHGQFGAQRVKDAIVDRFRDRVGVRPAVDKERPDLRIHAHLRGRGLTIAIDLSGDPLHRRGYRTVATEAPLKENLAAGLVMHTGWHDAPTPLLDPMCGSGTLPIEAAMMMLDLAPGGQRAFGFQRWLGHDDSVWSQLRQEAQDRAEQAKSRPHPPVLGRDCDARAIDIARQNARRAGVADAVRFEVGDVAQARPPAESPGWVIFNPPYGARLVDRRIARTTLSELGGVLGQHFTNWKVAMIVSDDGLMAALGLPALDTRAVDNGPIAARFVTAAVRGSNTSQVSDHPVANRMRKNLKRLRPWLRREGVTCYRLYDADIPEFNAALDVYEDHAVLQEYAPPKTIDPDQAARRITEIGAAAADVLGLPPDKIHVKVRRRQRGREQYERQAQEGCFITVSEGGLRFLVNPTDYLDTGLFLDHRITRARLRERARGRKFLNLFCYTATATVYAASGGASRTVSVDLSNTYLDWAARNLKVNQLDGSQHRLIRADVLRWLAQDDERFDLVFLDPPTFSTSKGMEGTLDVARDQVQLIDAVMNRIEPGGLLVFSTNARRFTLDPELTRRYAVEDWTEQTTPPDFSRGRPPHRCWAIRRDG